MQGSAWWSRHRIFDGYARKNLLPSFVIRQISNIRPETSLSRRTGSVLEVAVRILGSQVPRYGKSRGNGTCSLTTPSAF